MGNSCNHEHEEEIMYLLYEEERKIFAKIYLVWDVSAITVISSYLEFKGYSRSAVPD